MDRLEMLRGVPARDPQAAAAGRAHFLGQAEAAGALRSVRAQHRPGRPFPLAFPLRGSPPAFKALAAVLLVLALVFAGAASSVAAAQGSLPGEALYPLKTLSEDVLLSLAPSSPDRLSLTLDFGDRRLVEMTGLQSAGRPIPQGVVDRFEGELDQALQLAAGMSDPGMAQSLDRLSRRTQGQMQAMAVLVEHNPDAPLLADAYARLQEQAGTAELGKSDPQGFRLKVNQLFPGKNGTPGNGNKTPPGLEGTPGPNGNGSGGGSAQGTPDHGQDGKGGHKATKTPGGHGRAYGTPAATRESGEDSHH